MAEPDPQPLDYQPKPPPSVTQPATIDPAGAIVLVLGVIVLATAIPAFLYGLPLLTQVTEADPPLRRLKLALFFVGVGSVLISLSLLTIRRGGKRLPRIARRRSAEEKAAIR